MVVITTEGLIRSVVVLAAMTKVVVRLPRVVKVVVVAGEDR